MSRCYCCGETVLGGSIQRIPVADVLDYAKQEKRTAGQIHPIGGDPRTWTPRPVTGGKMTKFSKQVMEALKQLGYESESSGEEHNK